MLTDKRYANQRFGGMNTITFMTSPACPHRNGWYVKIPFWIFTKRIFVCSDCGHWSKP